MNKAWGSFTEREKNRWEKKIPHVSHQGVLWAQELGCCWEWPENGWGERNERRTLRCLLLSGCQHTTNLFHAPVTLSMRPQDDGTAHGCHLLRSWERQEGTAGASRAISRLSICSVGRVWSWNQPWKAETKALLTRDLAVDVTRGITFIDRLLGTSHLHIFFLIHKQSNHLKLILWIRTLTSKVFWYIQDHTMVTSKCRVGKEVCLLQSWPFRNGARTGSNGGQGKGRWYGAETLLTFPSPPQFSHPNVNFPNTNLNDPTEKIWKGKAVWVEGYGNQRT